MIGKRFQNKVNMYMYLYIYIYIYLEKIVKKYTNTKADKIINTRKNTYDIDIIIILVNTAYSISNAIEHI